MGKASNKARIRWTNGMQGLKSSEKKGGAGVWGNMVAITYLTVWIIWLAQKTEVWETERWEKRAEVSVIIGTSIDTAEVNSIQTLTHLICQWLWQIQDWLGVFILAPKPQNRHWKWGLVRFTSMRSQCLNWISLQFVRPEAGYSHVWLKSLSFLFSKPSTQY